MNALLDTVALWWAGGADLMPIMFGVALVLYLFIGERAWTLCGPGARRRARRDELERLLEDDHRGERDARWREWAARYVAAAEEAELTRGFLLIRTLTTCLPLLGLLGTVGGMVMTFDGLAQPRGPGAGALAQSASAGIGLALTATQYGMALAIPAVIAEWLLRRRIDSLVHDREDIARGVVAREESVIIRRRPAPVTTNDLRPIARLETT